MDDLHVNKARWESDGVRVAGCSPRAVALMLRGGASPAVDHVPLSCTKRVGGDVAHVNGRSRLQMLRISPRRRVICNYLSGIRNAEKIYRSTVCVAVSLPQIRFCSFDIAKWKILQLRLRPEISATLTKD